MDESGQETQAPRSFIQRLKDRISPPKKEPHQGIGLSGTRPTEELNQMAGGATRLETTLPQVAVSTPHEVVRRQETGEVVAPLSKAFPEITPASQIPPPEGAPGAWLRHESDEIVRRQRGPTPEQQAEAAEIDAKNLVKAKRNEKEPSLQSGRATPEQSQRFARSVQSLSSTLTGQDKKAA